MFPRVRRYRAFIALAVITVLAFYHFSGHETWSSDGPDGVSSLRLASLKPVQAFAEWQDEEAKKDEGRLEFAELQDEKHDAVGVETDESLTTSPFILADTQDDPLHVRPLPVAASTESLSTAISVALETTEKEQVTSTSSSMTKSTSKSKATTSKSKATKPTVYWSKQPENFPVDSTIQLPTGTPKAIPRIQHNFGKESEQDKSDRLTKLAAIKQAAEFTWQGYTEHAFLHDEVLPSTGGFTDPFCGWAATLVDSLDTLWIMGMRDQFEEAVTAVGTINFTTSRNDEIPVFETTIRYLGGLVGAYDISGHRYPTLLDKAVELAEVLMGVFDTPNHMPMTFYAWKPAFASQPHRADTRAVLSELGSLSLEFTRLAQITKESRYYDAIDRVTDSFYEWQNDVVNGTLVPGLFPSLVDASGCEKPAQIKIPVADILDGSSVGKTYKSAELKELLVADAVVVDDDSVRPGHPGKVGKIGGWDDPIGESTLDTEAARGELRAPKAGAGSEAVPASAKAFGNMGKISGWEGDVSASDSDAARKELFEEIHRPDDIYKRQLVGELADPSKDGKTIDTKLSGSEVCIPHGLRSSSTRGTDSFTLGGLADSTYEYLSKQYLLLGGLEPKYQFMYEKAMDASIQHLLFRPMTPGNENILFTGKYDVYARGEKKEGTGKLEAGAEHLACFAGGMFAMGAKIFGREADLDYGARLTEGCVWAYSSTETGIMPEKSLFIACADMDNCQWNETKYWEVLDPHAAARQKIWSAQGELRPQQPLPVKDTGSVMDPQAIVDTDVRGPPLESANQEVDTWTLNKRQKIDNYPEVARQARQPLSHEAFVRQKIELENLPPGVIKVDNRRYKLR